MDIGKKLTTLIKAAVHVGDPLRQKKYAADPNAQLQLLRKSLADVEKQERKLADMLKVARTKAQLAAEQGDQTQAKAEQRLVAELKAQLDVQSVRAITLTEKLTALEAHLTPKKDPTPRRSDAAIAADATPTRQSTSSPPASRDEDSDLTARKSRLSE